MAKTSSAVFDGYPQLPKSITRNSILRQSLFMPGAFPEESQTLRDATQPHQATKEKQIADKLPNELPEIPLRLNLGELARAADLKEIDRELYLELKIPVEEENEGSDGLDLTTLTHSRAKTVLVKYEDMLDMDSDTLTAWMGLSEDHALAVHRLLCTVDVDFKASIGQSVALEEANTFHREKLTAAMADLQRVKEELAVAKAAIQGDAAPIQKKLEEAKTALSLEQKALAVEQDRAKKYKRYWAETKESLKTAEKKLDEVPEEGVTQEMLDELNTEYQKEIADLKTQLEAAQQRGRPNSRANSRPPRSASSLSMERQRERQRQRDGKKKAEDKQEKSSKKSKSKKSSSAAGDPDSSDDESSSSDSSSSSESSDPSDDEDIVAVSNKKKSWKTADKGLVHYDTAMVAASKLHTGGKGLTVDKFTNDTTKLSHEQWEKQVETMLDNMTFKDKDSALRHIHGFTGGSVWIALNNQIPSKLKKCAGKPFSSVYALLKYIRMQWGIHNEEGKAHSNFFTLKQGDGERFSTFYRKYQTDRAHVHLESKTERQLFLGKLNSEYSEKFVTGSIPKKLSKMIKKCQILEQQMEQHKADHKKPSASGSGTAARGARAANANTTNTSNSTTGSTNSAAAAKTEDDSKKPFSSRPAKYSGLPAEMSKANRVQLLKEGKCLKCQEKGHMKNSDECPLKEYSMPKWATASSSITVANESENATSAA